MKARTGQCHLFKGVVITPAPPNGSGVRWVALGPLGLLRADTLAGMREVIRAQWAQVKQEKRS